MSGTGDYSPADYDAMFMDAARRTAYHAAIARVVRPGDVVVEVGTGFGYFAIAAVRAGARHVYAIERSPCVAIAAEMVRENGLTDRITCIRGDVRDVTLPELGNVLLSDLRGLTPLSAIGIPSLVAARRKLVRGDARHISLRDTMYAAPCEAPRNWRERELAIDATLGGATRHAAARLARSDLHRDHVEPDELLADAAVIGVVDYRTVESPDIVSHAEWVARRDGDAEGIALWFDAEIAEGISFTTAPGAPRTVYGHGFLPLAHTVRVRAGDRMTFDFRAQLVGGGYVYAWDTTLVGQGEGPAAPIRFRQSSLPALLLAPDLLERRRRDYRPQPAEVGLVADCVALVDGRRALADIGTAMHERHPTRFASAEEAADWVTSTLAALAELTGSSRLT